MKGSQSPQTLFFEQATSYRRLAARVIDLVFAAIILFPLSGMLGYLAEPELEKATIWALAFFGGLLIAYDTILLGFFGKTLGKKVCALRLTDRQGKRPNWGYCLLRTILLYLSVLLVVSWTLLTITLFGWYLMSALGRYDTFPHDTLTKTFVLREYQGKLKEAPPKAAPAEGARVPAPFADLQRLRAQGIISEEEYQKKRKELRF
jgi:uncharacterized RDD family membrane protein YckC